MLRLSKEVVSFIKPTENQSFSIYNLLEIKLLIPFLANAPFYSPRKYPEIVGFLVLLGGIKW